MESLQGKRVLFIGIGFYDYENIIKENLEKYGAIIDFYLEQPNYLLNGLYGKIINKLKYRKNIIKKHHKKILKETKLKKYDLVFVLKGENLTTDFIKALKLQQEKAIFIMYQWDSLNRVSNALDMIPYFDKVFSFDRLDCQKYEKLEFRPLFFRKSKEVEIINPKYDLVFIGWLHADRMDLIKNIEKNCKTKNIKTFFYLYTGIKTYINFLLKKQSQNLYIKPLNYSNVQDLHFNTKVILDLPHPFQNGLTMRTIEAIGANKKLITTNQDIKNYDFYDENNICIIYKENIEIKNSFFKKPYKKISDEIKDKYSLDKWINDIFRDSTIKKEIFFE